MDRNCPDRVSVAYHSRPFLSIYDGGAWRWWILFAKPHSCYPTSTISVTSPPPNDFTPVRHKSQLHHPVERIIPCPTLFQNLFPPARTSSGIAKPRLSFRSNTPTSPTKVPQACRRPSRTRASSKISRYGGLSRSLITIPCLRTEWSTRLPVPAAGKRWRRIQNQVRPWPWCYGSY